MTSDNTSEDPVRILTETEEDIGKLYEAYSRNMPEHEEFWFGLVLEEADHANMVHSLVQKVGTGPVAFSSDPDTLDRLKNLRDFLVREKENLKEENLSFTDALRVALEIENSITKNSIYHLFKNPSGDMVDIMDRLRHSNNDHLRFLRMELEKYEKKG